MSEDECDECGELMIWVDDDQVWRCYNCGNEVED